MVKQNLCQVCLVNCNIIKRDGEERMKKKIEIRKCNVTAEQNRTRKKKKKQQQRQYALYVLVRMVRYEFDVFIIDAYACMIRPLHKLTQIKIINNSKK
jgi:hypothetical protein